MAKPSSLGVTEGTRTADLQGHNLRWFTDRGPSPQVRDGGDLGAVPGPTDAGRGWAGTTGGGVGVV